MCKEYLTETEVSKLLQASVKTLQRWRWKKEGPAFIRIAKNMVRYRKEDLEKWIKTKMVFPEK